VCGVPPRRGRRLPYREEVDAVTDAQRPGQERRGSLHDVMLPRDRAAAARSVRTLCAVAIAITVAFAPLAVHDPGAGPLPLWLAGATVALVGGMCALGRWWHHADWMTWTAGPLMAVAAIVVVDLLTRDASVSAQIFFLFPTVYGASILRRPGAAVMTVASLLGELVVVSAQLPARTAVTDFGYVAAALVTVAVMLTLAGERQESLVARLRHQAAIDPLTGLFTRRVLHEAATSALSGAGSDEGTSLIVLDVDRFKAVNDTFGHPAGDELLVQLATMLRLRCRSGDLVCRMGGDEIAVLMPACSAAAAQRRAETVLADVRTGSFLVADGQLVDVTVSIGLAHAPTHAADLGTLYAAADAALYEAKRQGRDRMVDPSWQR
jgi:diguanylate cyclase (GGDEF)-like protein